MTDYYNNWRESVEAALSIGKRIVPTKTDLNSACEYIVQLLSDASTLLKSNSHATSAFISITAMEETSKLHVGMYRRAEEPAGRRMDPLYSHGKKHHLALGPTVAMGSRLNNALGNKRLQELMGMAQSGELERVRESAMYFEQTEEILVTPQAVITRDFARELLLVAIEVFDDAVVGYTDRSFKFRQHTDRLFMKWAKG